MGKLFQGRFNGSRYRFAIVVSRFNDAITSRLLEGAQDTLHRHGVEEDRIDVAWVPGAMEIPVTALRLARSGRYHGVVCLGAVIRGQTPHFDHVSGTSASGVGRAALKTGLPVIYGILTTDTTEQALERAGVKSGNKGGDAAMAALEMADLFRVLDEEDAAAPRD